MPACFRKIHTKILAPNKLRFDNTCTCNHRSLTFADAKHFWYSLQQFLPRVAEMSLWGASIIADRSGLCCNLCLLNIGSIFSLNNSKEVLSVTCGIGDGNCIEGPSSHYNIMFWFVSGSVQIIKIIIHQGYHDFFRMFGCESRLCAATQSFCSSWCIFSAWGFQPIKVIIKQHWCKNLSAKMLHSIQRCRLENSFCYHKRPSPNCFFHSCVASQNQVIPAVLVAQGAARYEAVLHLLSGGLQLLANQWRISAAQLEPLISRLRSLVDTLRSAVPGPSRTCRPRTTPPDRSRFPHTAVHQICNNVQLCAQICIE